MRRYLYALTLACLVTGAVSCHPQPPEPPPQADLDIAATNAIADTGVTNAILAQHSLFPYHFVLGSTELNDLGRRELGLLAAHFRQTGGDLNVRRGEETLELYQGRVLRVQQFLLAMGVPADGVAVLDGPPGGTGISSERIVSILTHENSQTGSGGGASAGGGAQAGASTGGSSMGGQK